MGKEGREYAFQRGAGQSAAHLRVRLNHGASDITRTFLFFPSPPLCFVVSRLLSPSFFLSLSLSYVQLSRKKERGRERVGNMLRGKIWNEKGKPTVQSLAPSLFLSLCCPGCTCSFRSFHSLRFLGYCEFFLLYRYSTEFLFFLRMLGRMREAGEMRKNIELV